MIRDYHQYQTGVYNSIRNARTVWTDAEAWRRTHGYYAGLIHKLFLLPAVTIFNLIPDYMHCVDLGCSHYALGSALFELVYLPQYFPAARTLAARRDALWDRIAAQYLARGTRVQISNMELSFFADTQAPHQSFPVLTSRIKAAETRRNRINQMVIGKYHICSVDMRYDNEALSADHRGHLERRVL